MFSLRTTMCHGDNRSGHGSAARELLRFTPLEKAVPTYPELLQVSNLANFRYSKGCPTGALGGVISFGRSKDSGRRTAGKCTAPLQAQGAAGRHHQRGQAALVLHEARREDAHEAGAGTQTQPQEGPQGTGRVEHFRLEY